MDKTAVKKFAIWARNKLIEDTKYQAGLVGITEKGIAEPLPQSNAKMQFFDIGLPQPYRIENEVITERQHFVEKLNEETAKQESYEAAYRAVVDRVAYTWFNRLIAVRYMEVNTLLPSRTRVLSSMDGRAEPQIVTSPFEAKLDYTPAEQQQIISLKNDNKLDEVFRLLFLKQCAALGSCLPKLFEQVDDYMPLLLAISFTDKDGVVWHLINDIPESDWKDAAQIVGWLYQYYNTEPKEQVFANLKKNIKISKENIPAATQLFTPDWIVRYMVENSLGRLWVEGHPDFDRANWKYYLDEASQEPQVAQKLAELRKGYATLEPENIKCIDPCMGSGHILAYLFDVLMQIYRSVGYSDRDAAASIVKNNLYGLDIDDRAAQMAYFVVMMKACQYDNRFLRRPQCPHIYAIEESNGIDRNQLKFFGKGLTDFERNEALLQLNGLLDTLKDAKEYGSILNMENYNWALLRSCAETAGEETQLSMDSLGMAGTVTQLKKLIDVGEALGQKYDVVVTNPPYMGASGMNARLSEYVKKHYPDSKSDLFAVFIEQGNEMIKRLGFNCMVTMQSWMFLSSFEKMRVNALQNKTITNLMHMENMVMGIAFGTAVTVFRNAVVHGYKGTYNQIKLKDIENDIPKQFPVKWNRFAQVSADNFSKIPGSPVAYWVSKRMLAIFEDGTLLGNLAYAKQGIATADNNRFLRRWSEVEIDKACFGANNHEEAKTTSAKWFPYNKGGEFRKWYGNNDYIVNWANDGLELKGFKGSVIRNPMFYFKECFSWSLVSSGMAAFRYKPVGQLFDVAGMSCFVTDRKKLLFLLALCNTKVVMKLLEIIAPTINYQCGDIANIPVIEVQNDLVSEKVEENISISKFDWDAFETSWDFKKNPLV